MNEGQKTGVFATIAAVLAVGAALIAWPENYEVDTESTIGKPLFKEFKDVLDVARVRIDEYDEDLAQLSSFEAKRDAKSGDWALPTHNNYPAEATERIRDLAAALIDLTVLDVASEVTADHAKFGVLAPNSDSLELGDEGVGRLVVLENESNDSLVNLIVGGKVKDDPTKRFVRVPTQQITHVVSLNGDVLKTTFRDWIQDNLLNLSAFDVQTIRIRDYSVNPALQDNPVNKKLDFDISVDQSNRWNATKTITYQKGESAEIELGEDEELNANKLVGLLRAIDDLNIVNAIKKPRGLADDLRSKDTFRKDRTALESLASRGFYLDSALNIPEEEKNGDVLGVNGALLASLKNGVEYVLRFGDVEGVSDEDPAGGEATSGVNRFLLVTTRINENQFPKVKELPIPKSWEELHPETEDDENKEGEGETDSSQDLTDEEKLEELEAAQEKARKTNQRAQDARDEQIEEAQKKVRQLNERFADWYYVISEGEYRKIHLSLADVIRKKQQPATTSASPATATPPATQPDSVSDAETQSDQK